MRAFGLAIGVLTLAAIEAVAAENRLDRSLQMLAPAERLEQLCDFTAMARIRKESSAFRPDRAVANATAEPVIVNDTIEARGAAFRSGGKWYALAFACTASPDHMTVVTFNYTIGAEIPEAKWVSDNLWQ
ncbi:MAG TPA: DUF930 domain-containing protein [Pseudolabrys sp.]|jgi:hypothetical protein